MELTQPNVYCIFTRQFTIADKYITRANKVTKQWLLPVIHSAVVSTVTRATAMVTTVVAFHSDNTVDICIQHSHTD